MATRRGNREGSVIERSKTRFEVRIWIDGKQRTVGYRRSRAEAHAFRREATSLRDQGRLLAGRGPTLGAYLADWLENVKSMTLRPQSFPSYDGRLKCVYEEIGDIRLEKLTRDDVQRCYANLLARGQSPATIRLTHTILRQAMTRARRDGKLVVDPTEFVELPRIEHESPPVFTPALVRRIFEETQGDRFHALWVVLLTTGLRMGEALGLVWQDIGEHSLRIERTLTFVKGQGTTTGPPKTRASRREVDLGPTVLEVLRAHRKGQLEQRLQAKRWDNPDLVFPNTHGGLQPKRRVYVHWREMLERLAIPYAPPHTTRHTYATWLITDGERMQIVQKELGHADIGTTLGMYVHLDPKMGQAAAQRIEQILATPEEALDEEAT